MFHYILGFFQLFWLWTVSDCCQAISSSHVSDAVIATVAPTVNHRKTLGEGKVEKSSISTLS